MLAQNICQPVAASAELCQPATNASVQGYDKDLGGDGFDMNRPESAATVIDEKQSSYWWSL